MSIDKTATPKVKRTDEPVAAAKEESQPQIEASEDTVATPKTIAATGTTGVIVTPPAPPMPAMEKIPHTTARPVLTDAGSVDLVLEDVRRSEEATLVAGPSYQIRFRNQGTRDATRFTVAIVAVVDDTLNLDAPRVVMEVPALATGEMQKLVLRMPLMAMKMPAGLSEPRRPFTHLFVIVDAAGMINELDETNNSALVERSAVSPTE